MSEGSWCRAAKGRVGCGRA